MDISDINVGTVFMWKDDPYKVLFREHSKTGRAGAVLRTKIKNLSTGASREETFKSSDKFDEANITTGKMQYLYQDGDIFNFMNNEDYEQVAIDKNIVGEKNKYLKEGADIEIVFLDKKPLDVNIPIKMSFKVIQSPPSIKGNTADGGSKQITLENGLNVSVPLFIKEGDVVKINTETGEYVERN